MVYFLIIGGTAQEIFNNINAKTIAVNDEIKVFLNDIGAKSANFQSHRMISVNFKVTPLGKDWIATPKGHAPNLRTVGGRIMAQRMSKFITVNLASTLIPMLLDFNDSQIRPNIVFGPNGEVILTVNDHGRKLVDGLYELSNHEYRCIMTGV